MFSVEYTGTWFAGPMVRLTSMVRWDPWPSFTWMVKLSSSGGAPAAIGWLISRKGVYSSDPPLVVSVPLLGPVTVVKVGTSPSGS